MSELAEYKRRIAAALDRIGQGLGTRSEAAAGDAGQAAGDAELTAEMDRLRTELASERASNGQLIERVRAVRRKQERAIAGLQRRITELKREADAAAEELQRQKRLVAEIADTNRALRAAAEAGVTDPELLNKSLMNEVEALRASRAAEIAEISAILSELAPAIGEAEAEGEGRDA